MDEQAPQEPNNQNPEISGPPSPESMAVSGENTENSDTSVVFGEQSPIDAPNAEYSATETEAPAPEVSADEPAQSTVDSSEPQESQMSQESQNPFAETNSTNPLSATTSDSVNFNTETPTESVAPDAPAATFEPVPEKPKKKSNMSSLLMLLMFIITLCGVGFGVYGIFFAPGKQVEKVVYQNVETETVVASDPNYIYIGEWGLKIKLPENIDAKHISYQYQGESESGLGYSVVRLWGQTNSATALTDYANPAKNSASMTIVSLIPENYACEASCPTIIALESGQKIGISHPQAVFSPDETVAKAEVADVETIYKTFSSPENYSAF